MVKVPKTKNAFAFREFYQVGKFGSVDDISKVVEKIFGRGFSDYFIEPRTRYNEVVYNLAYHKHMISRGKFLRKLVTRHIKRLKNFLGIITTQAIKNGAAYSNEIKEKIARIEKLLADYKFVYEGVNIVNSTTKKSFAHDKKEIKTAAAEEFGRKLRIARRNKGYLSKDFADLLNVSQNGYSQYETGTNEPPLYLIRKMADHLDVSTDWLFGRVTD